MLKIIIVSLLLVGVCYAQESTFETKTGYGYFKDKENRIVSKAELPKGKHSLAEGYTYVEVSTLAALEKVKIYEEPKLPDELKEEAIQKEQREILRKQAVDSLKAKGVLDENEEIKDK